MFQHPGNTTLKKLLDILDLAATGTSQILKESIMMPILKKKINRKSSISLTNSCCKTLERIISMRMYSYLEYQKNPFTPTDKLSPLLILIHCLESKCGKPKDSMLNYYFSKYHSASFLILRNCHRGSHNIARLADRIWVCPSRGLNPAQSPSGHHNH